MIHAVIDTNILVSAFLSNGGNEADLLRAIRRGFLRPCLTDEVMEEYIEVLSRSKFSFVPSEVEDLLTFFRSSGKLVHRVENVAVSPDPTDTKFLQCAFAASADFLVTGNKRHFPASPYGPTYVVSASELLAYLDPALPIRS